MASGAASSYLTGAACRSVLLSLSPACPPAENQRAGSSATDYPLLDCLLPSSSPPRLASPRPSLSCHLVPRLHVPSSFQHYMFHPTVALRQRQIANKDVPSAISPLLATARSATAALNAFRTSSSSDPGAGLGGTRSTGFSLYRFLILFLSACRTRPGDSMLDGQRGEVEGIRGV